MRGWLDKLNGLHLPTNQFLIFNVWRLWGFWGLYFPLVLQWGITSTNSSLPVPLPSLPYELWSHIWPPSTSASSGCQSDNGCLAAIRLTGLVGACNRWGQISDVEGLGKIEAGWLLAGRFFVGWDLGRIAADHQQSSSQLLATGTISWGASTTRKRPVATTFVLGLITLHFQSKMILTLSHVHYTLNWNHSLT